MTEVPVRDRKLCFVTVGATAPFHTLVRAVLRPTFLQSLAVHAYTDLLIQHGSGGDAVIEECGPAADANGLRHSEGINVSGFAFQDTLAREFRAVRAAEYGFTKPGCMISHAGTGSILEGLRQNLTMVVVANTALLDNHQEELAEELARQGYVVHGKLESASGRGGAEAAAGELAGAVVQAEALRAKQTSWPPANSDEAPGQARKGLNDVMDEEMGFARLD